MPSYSLYFVPLFLVLASSSLGNFPNIYVHPQTLPHDEIQKTTILRDAANFPTGNGCGERNDVALIDGRFFGSPAQCRISCTSFKSSDIDLDVKDTTCKFFQTEKGKSFSEDDKILCIPRGECIRHCGPESPGCVYSGACTSQVCFSSSLNSAPAKLERVTYAGPGSYVSVGSHRTSAENNTPQVTFELRRAEWCGSIRDIFRKFKYVRRSASECLSSDVLQDGRLEELRVNGTQCRASCEKYRDPLVEVVVFMASCGFCDTEAATDFIDSISGKVCIPRKVCERHCGPPRPGCVYTGSCRSQLCYSGIDSKKPAHISWTSDNNVRIVVDNEENATTIDPPVFSGLSVPSPSTTPPSASPKKTDAGPVMNTPSTPAQPSSSPPSPSKVPVPENVSEETSNSVGNETSPSSSESPRDSGPSVWVWAGPLMGALVGAVGAIAAAFVIRSDRYKEHPPEVTPQTDDGFPEPAE